MAQYIPKSTLVAEIEKIRSKWFGINNDFADGQKGALTDVLSLISTLEVKEVDPEKENLTPNDISIIGTIIIGLIEELKFRINKWPGEKIFEEALKRFRVQKKNDDGTN